MSKWKRQSFKEAPIEIIDGDRGVNYPKKAEFQEQGYCLFLNTGNVTKDGFDFSSLDFISEENDALLRKGKAKPDDIILTTRGTVGNVGYFNKNISYDNIRINSGMVILRANTQEIYPYFLYAYLRSNVFKKQILKNTSGSAQPQLPISSLHNVIFPYPNISTQKSIAAVLSALDAKIELNNRINAELESLAKTIYDYWFVQFDFPNVEGKPYKSSGGAMVCVGDGGGDRAIPAGWKIGRVSDLFEINPSETLSKGNVSAYIDMSAIPTSGFMTGEIQYKPFNGGMKFRNGDVVIARITPCLENGKTGLITLLKDNEVGFGSTEFIVLRGKNRSLSSFAACLSRSTSFRNFAISNMTGTSGRKRVDAKAIERFSIPIPEDGLISQFEDVVSRYFQLLTINTIENQQLTQLRDWLLPMLMNGQVSIK